MREANRRLEIITTFKALLLQGTTKAMASRQVATGYATLWRWLREFDKHGYNGLLPDTDKCGRKSILEKLGVTQQTIDQMRGIGLDTESATASARLFAQSDRCPEELARVILDPNKSSKHALPPSLRRAITVSGPEKLAHRGQRALSLKGGRCASWTFCRGTFSARTIRRRSGRGGCRG